jgi:hypothetical protein
MGLYSCNNSNVNPGSPANGTYKVTIEEQYRYSPQSMYDTLGFSRNYDSFFTANLTITGTKDSIDLSFSPNRPNIGGRLVLSTDGNDTLAYIRPYPGLPYSAAFYYDKNTHKVFYKTSLSINHLGSYSTTVTQ